MTQLLSIAVALAGGLFMTRIVGKFKLPDVTAYLIAGLLIGPSILGRLAIPGLGFMSFEDVKSLDIICDIALGFIAFAIGNEFRLEQIRKIGKQALIVGIFQAVATSALVDIILVALHFFIPDVLSIPAVITLGAIASATAPAATLMVVRQYKAKGPVTEILLPVVALDDAVGLVIFSFSFGIAKAINSGTASLSEIIGEPIIEILLSLAFGAMCGWLLSKAEAIFNSNRNRNTLVVSFVILTVAVSKAVFSVVHFKCGFSSLLVCMMLGTVFCNLSPLSEDIMQRSDSWTAPLMTLFFVLSGASLRLDLLSDMNIILIGMVYIISRSLGKYLGARFSSKLAGCSDDIIKYLGITLLPQAGVALGMSSLAMTGLGDADGGLIRNITLFGVLIYELVGPSLTKRALTKAGDIQPKSAEVENRRAEKIKKAHGSL